MGLFRNLLRISLLSFVVGCCAGTNIPNPTNSSTTSALPHTAAPIDRGKIAESMKQKTVAILSKGLSGSFSIPSCAGVWISGGLILTAFHCVDDEVPDFRYTSQQDFESLKVYPAVLIAVDRTRDLAVLLTPPEDRPEHLIAELSRDEILVGDQASMMGHTSGYAWTYANGYVSAVREDAAGPSEVRAKALQIAAPIWMGNSGGGAFDAHGRLIGLCSWVAKNGPQLSFFIHRDEIAAFLQKEKIMWQP